MSEQIIFTEKKIKKKTKPQWERILAVVAILTFAAAWLVGYQLESGELESFLSEAMPAAAHFEKLSADTYAAYADDGADQLIGYVTIGEANGYGGPLQAAVGVDLEGNVSGLKVIKHRETPSWYRKVMESDYVSTLLGKSYQDAFQLGEDVDGVTSATYTSRAIAQAVLAGSREVAGEQLGLSLPSQAKPKIVFGVPEITLLALFGVGFIGHQGKFKYKKQLRWVAMLVGLVVLGFVYNAPLTLAYFNKLLLGFWPNWRTSLYWYLLLGGILFVFTVDNKNPYCYWFCPFGAAQECMGAVGGAKVYSPGRYRNFLMWLRRGVVWFAIVVALLFRSPGITSYEIFGTLFSFLGSNLQFILLALVLVVSLFVKRPWCTYLCPIDPVVDFIRMARKWILELWKKIKPKRRKEGLN